MKVIQTSIPEALKNFDQLPNPSSSKPHSILVIPPLFPGFLFHNSLININLCFLLADVVP